MKYSGGLWLRDWLLVYNGMDPTIDDLCRLLVFAYVVDLPKEFVDIAWKLFLHHKGPFLSPYTQAVILVDHPLLHKDLARKAINLFSASEYVTNHQICARPLGCNKIQMLPVILSGNDGACQLRLENTHSSLLRSCEGSWIIPQFSSYFRDPTKRSRIHRT